MDLVYSRSTSPPVVEEESSTSALADLSCCQNDNALDRDSPMSLTNKATTVTVCTDDDTCIVDPVHKKDHTPHAICTTKTTIRQSTSLLLTKSKSDQSIAVESPPESLLGFTSMLNEHILTCKLNAALLCGDFRNYMRPARLQKLAFMMDGCCQQIRHMDVSSPAMASRYQAMQDAREALDSAHAALSILESHVSQCLRENRQTELQLPTPVSQTDSTSHTQQPREQSILETPRENDAQINTMSQWTDFLDDELCPLSPDSQ